MPGLGPGALWRHDREAGVLRCVEVWHTESVAVPEFEAASRASTFKPGVGLPGRVWSSREPAFIPDVVHDLTFDVRPSPGAKRCTPPSACPSCSAATSWASWSSQP